MKIILIASVLLLLSGCTVFNPTMEDTITTVKSNNGCSHIGTQIKLQIKNIDGVESIFINCTWTVQEEKF
jgi:hypothetical protein